MNENILSMEDALIGINNEIENGDVHLMDVLNTGEIGKSFNIYKSDVAFMEIAMTYNPFIFQYADLSIRSNKDFVMNHIVSYACNFVEIVAFVGKNLLADKEVALALVGQSGYNYKYLPKALKLDDDIAILAAENGGYRFLNKRYRGNKKLFLSIAKTYPTHIRFANKNLRHDIEVVDFVLAQNSYIDFNAAVNGKSICALLYLPLKFRNDLEYVFKSVDNDPRTIIGASQRIQRLVEGKDPADCIRSILNMQKVSKALSENFSDKYFADKLKANITLNRPNKI